MAAPKGRKKVKLLHVFVQPVVAVLDEHGEVEATLNVQLEPVPAKLWNGGWKLDMSSIAPVILQRHAQNESQRNPLGLIAADPEPNTIEEKPATRQVQRATTRKVNKKKPALKAVEG